MDSFHQIYLGVTHVGNYKKIPFNLASQCVNGMNSSNLLGQQGTSERGVETFVIQAYVPWDAHYRL